MPCPARLALVLALLAAAAAPGTALPLPLPPPEAALAGPSAPDGAVAGASGPAPHAAWPRKATGLAPVPGNDANDGETYFALGDSITALGAGAVALDPSRNGDHDRWPDAAEPRVNARTYIHLLRDLHDPDATSDGSMAGSGQGTAWGLAEVGRYLAGAHPGQTFVVLLGHNDAKHGAGPAESAAALAAIHDRVRAAGARGVWCNLVVPAAGSPLAADFAERVAAIDAAARADGQVAVPFYDVLDVHPGNGRIDAQDPQYFFDGIHPNGLGQVRMARLLAAHLGLAEEAAGAEAGAAAAG